MPSDDAKPKYDAFISYASEDRTLARKLCDHLRIAQVEVWIDEQNLLPGENFNKAIFDQIANKTRIFVACVSVDYLNSEFCQREMNAAMELHRQYKSIVIPVILRSAVWKKSPLGELSALPYGAKPVTKSRNRDDVFTEIAEAISRVVELVSDAEISAELEVREYLDRELKRRRKERSLGLLEELLQAAFAPFRLFGFKQPRLGHTSTIFGGSSLRLEPAFLKKPF